MENPAKQSAPETPADTNESIAALLQGMSVQLRELNDGQTEFKAEFKAEIRKLNLKFNRIEDSLSQVNRRVESLERTARSGDFFSTGVGYGGTPDLSTKHYNSAPSWREQTWLGPYRRRRD
ncbi:MAG: hypothetical protein AB9900_02535 [Humidesulfovibrio sp.]